MEQQASEFWKNSAMANKIKTVSVIGLGYVGLPTAAIIASHGIKVIGVDIDPMVVSSITGGKAPLVEPGLDKLVHSGVASGNLKADIEPGPADIFIISVPTPFKNDKVPDLSYLKNAVKTLAPVISSGNLIIIESTSPVGTTKKMRDYLGTIRPDLRMPGITNKPDINIAHSPERILPGNVLKELVQNDRVIGGITPNCAEKTASFYRLFVDGICHKTDSQTAELVKLAENAYRDTNIAFANELSLLCYKHKINVWEMVKLANRHPRVNILQPGPGVGGHCIAVDPWFLVASAPNLTPLIQAARLVNDNKPDAIVEQILSRVGEVEAKSISFLGLAYKADIDDLRESPAIKIVKTIADRFKGNILVCEPNVTSLPAILSTFPTIKLLSLTDCLSNSEIIVLLTDHREFTKIPVQLLASKSIIDTRGVWQTAPDKV